MNDLINEGMFEFAMVISHLIKRGYEFVEIEYGEQRLGIGPKLILRKNDERFVCYYPSELEGILTAEIDRDWKNQK